jgi:hypothetical protein
VGFVSQALKRRDKVRYFGVSNQNGFQLEYLQSFLPDPPGGEPGENEPAAPRLCRSLRFIQSKLTALP